MKVTIDGKEIELELTEEQKAAVEEALRSKTTGWERVPLSDKYFTVNDIGFSYNFCENDDEYDNRAYDIANYFSSEELTTNIARAQNLQRQLWRRSAELCDKTDWLSKDNNGYCIFYDYFIHGFIIGSYICTRHFGQVYFDTEKHAEQALEEFRDELTWYFTEFKSRMD